MRSFIVNQIVNSRRKGPVFLLMLLFIGQLQYSFAWGSIGHRVIAEIAENHLNKKAKRNIKKLIGDQKLAYWSNWADFIKSDPDSTLNSTGSWHFINTRPNLNFDEFVIELDNSPEDNLYKAYKRIKKEAMHEQEYSLVEKQQQLYFLIHLFGDLHQPMHVSRKEDQGGNRIPVTFFDRKTNIHRVWDTDLVENDKYSYTEYARVLDIHQPVYYEKYYVPLEQMLFESHQLANAIYDDVKDNTKLSYPYVYANKYIMEECLYKAGIRLAAELNQIYG